MGVMLFWLPPMDGCDQDWDLQSPNDRTCFSVVPLGSLDQEYLFWWPRVKNVLNHYFFLFVYLYNHCQRKQNWLKKSVSHSLGCPTLNIYPQTTLQYWKNTGLNEDWCSSNKNQNRVSEVHSNRTGIIEKIFCFVFAICQIFGKVIKL